MSSERDEQQPEEHENSRPTKPTPLPKLQLFIILLVQFAEPITALVIYPFINQLVRDTGINKGDETKTGYYAGVIESTFFLAECLSVVQWGYLSDRMGRRPVLLLGPLGLAISATLFGLSSSFWRLLTFRAFQGVFNGNIGVSKSVIAEITDDTNIGEAFIYIPLMWSTGVTVAPLLGGVLSKPAERWPDTLGKVPLLRAYPYFLPCAVAGIVAFGTFLVGLFGLKETHPGIIAKNRGKALGSQVDEAPVSTTPLLHGHGDNDYGTLVVNQPSSETHHVIPTNTSLFYRPLMLVYINYIFLTFCDMSNSVLIPLMYSTPIEYGGLGLQPIHIGIAQGTFGFCNAIFQSQIYSVVVKKFGTRRIFQFASFAFCLVFLIYPALKFFSNRAGGVDAFVIICIVLQFCIMSSLYMSYAAIQVLIVQSIPEGGPLGTANGVGQMIASGMRTIAPTIASSLFSVSIKKNLLGGNLCFYLLFGLTVIGARVSLLLIEPSTLKKKKERDSRDSSINGVTN